MLHIIYSLWSERDTLPTPVHSRPLNPFSIPLNVAQSYDMFHIRYDTFVSLTQALRKSSFSLRKPCRTWITGTGTRIVTVSVMIPTMEAPQSMAQQKHTCFSPGKLKDVERAFLKVYFLCLFHATLSVSIGFHKFPWGMKQNGGTAWECPQHLIHPPVPHPSSLGHPWWQLETSPLQMLPSTNDLAVHSTSSPSHVSKITCHLQRRCIYLLVGPKVAIWTAAFTWPAELQLISLRC